MNLAKGLLLLGHEVSIIIYGQSKDEIFHDNGITFYCVKNIKFKGLSLFLTQKKVENWMIYLINAAEDMISAMLLVVMLTLVMQYSRKHLAGTDFTFQVALMATVSGGLYSLSGILGDALGYQNYLNLLVIVAIICLIPIFRWMKIEEKV